MTGGDQGVAARKAGGTFCKDDCKTAKGGSLVGGKCRRAHAEPGTPTVTGLSPEMHL